MKKILIVKIIITVLILNILGNTYASNVDVVSPSIIAMYKSNKVVKNGETVVFSVAYSDNTEIKEITLNSKDIELNGFKANIEVAKLEDNKCAIVLSNIEGSVGANKYISIAANTAVDTSGNYARAISRSAYFRIANSEDIVEPQIEVSKPNKEYVKCGESIEYTVKYQDNIGISKVNLKDKDINLNGFTAKKEIEKINENEYKIILSNIQGEIARTNSITIDPATAEDEAGNKAAGISMSERFAIVEPTITTTGEEIDIIKTEELSDFESNNDKFDWKNKIDYKIYDEIEKMQLNFTVKRENVENLVENTFATDDSSSIYEINYYNNTKQTMKDTKLNISIPKKIKIIEADSNAKIVYEGEDITVIQWNIGDIASNSGNKLTAKVSYVNNIKTGNKALCSEFITKAELFNTKEHITKCIRQNYIDTKNNLKFNNDAFLKIYMFNPIVNPSEKITKTDFARIILDSGIIKYNEANEKLNYSDLDSIKQNEIKAISTFTNYGIYGPDMNGYLHPNEVLTMSEMYIYMSKILEIMYPNIIEVEETIFYKDSYEDAISYESIELLESLNIIETKELELYKDVTIKDLLEIVNNIQYKTDITNINKFKLLVNKKFSEDDRFLMIFASKNFKYTYNEDMKIIKTGLF